MSTVSPKRLTGNEIADLIRDWPDGLADLALELRSAELEVYAGGLKRAASLEPDERTRQEPPSEVD